MSNVIGKPRPAPDATLSALASGPAPEHEEPGPWARMTHAVARPDDTPTLTRKKHLLLLVALMMAAGSLFWYGGYFWLGARIAALGPLSYQLLTILSVALFLRSGDLAAFGGRQQALALLVPIGIHVALGGYLSSSAVIVWSLLAPTCALFLRGARASLAWFVAYALVVIGLAALDGRLSARAVQLPPNAVRTFFAINLGGTGLVALAAVRYFARRLEHEQQLRLQSNQRLSQTSTELAAALTLLETKERLIEEATLNTPLRLANLSGEIRTPLKTVVDISKMVERAAAALGAPKIAPNLHKINVAGRYALGMVDDALERARIAAGQLEVSPEPCALFPLVEDLAAIIEPLAKKKWNRLVVECANDIGELPVDVSKLRRVLLDLLMHAVRSTTEGTITLHLSETSPVAVTFRISDTGAGIPPDQIGGAPGEPPPPEVLDLALIRRLCDLLGGELSAATELGVGSTFEVHLTRPMKPRRR